MKKALSLITISLAAFLFICTASHAAEKREKFGEDPRHKEAQRVSYKTSTENIKWKMVTPWSKGLLFHDIAVHFADSVRLASAGRLDIKPFSADELVPAMQSFDAVMEGVAEVGHDWPGYWKGRNEAFVALGDVPFGLDPEGYNIWLYERDGLALMQEIYGKFNLFVLPGGQTGQDMGLFSNKRATKMEDFKGLRIRTPGWYMDIMNNLGAAVSPLPGGEVYLALERGVIDAAEFSAPAMNYPMGFDDITKYAIQPGIHQPASQCGLFFNMEAWKKLPEDLKQIVIMCAKETQLWSLSWINNLNAKAMVKIKEKVEIVQMDKETLIEIRKITQAYLETLKQKYPDVKKILDSQDQFKEEYAVWRKARVGVTPWPYETYIGGTISE